MRDSVDVAAMLREAPDKANVQLAAMWHAVLGRRDPVEIVGHAIMRRRIPCPTVAMVHAAHAARYA